MTVYSAAPASSGLAARQRGAVGAIPAAAVLAAMTFNLALCFVNARHVSLGNGAIIACEIVIISAVLCFSYPAVDYERFLVISFALLYLVGLAEVRVAFFGEGLQVKPIRDILIPIAFFLLGARTASIRYADVLVRAAAALVVAVALFEFVFPDLYTRVFDVAKFYVGRGTMLASQAQYSSNLFISGMRPEELGGRNLLPFLGEHRASSIFLEPVSAGNFGIIVFMWALVRSLQTRRIFWGLFAAAATMIVLSDSRFGAFFCIVCLGLAVMPVTLGAAATMISPAIALACLIFLPDALSHTHLVGNGFVSRIILSGKFLNALDVGNWFGVTSPPFTPFDSGYAYLFIGCGVIGALAFWVLLWSISGSTWQFMAFRMLAGAYYAVLLSVSNSPFTIKTASLLWFLIGVLSRTGDPRGPSRPAPHRRRIPETAVAAQPLAR